jgi:cytidylate kinase
MKFISEKMVGATSGPKYVQFEEDFGPKFDQIWEKYAKFMITTQDRLILEGKTTGFFVKDPKVYEVMVIANTEARVKRAQIDEREDAENTIRSRDLEVRQRWFDAFGIDMYNLHQIESNYDLIMDNSSMDLEQELEFIIKGLLESGKFPDIDPAKFPSSYKESVELFWANGKDFFREKLMGDGLRINSEQVLKHWQDNFKDELLELDIDISKWI